MHVGTCAIFQNPKRDEGFSDFDAYRRDMALAKLAEPLNFDSVWSIEHHFTDYTMCPSPTQFLSYMAGHSKNIKLGSMVIVLPWHDPIRVAEEVAQLDTMSEGRMILGIGRGLGRVEYEGFRVDMNEARGRFVEYAEMVLEGLEKGHCEYQGDFINQPKVDIRPEPHQTFRQRTYAAAVSPESCKIMADLGVGIMIVPQKPWAQHVEDLVEYRKLYLDIHGTEAPRPMTAGWVCCHEDPVRAEEMADEYLVGYWDSVQKHYEIAGEHFAKTKGYEFYAGGAERVRKVGGNAASEFFKSLQIWGTPDQCYEQIQAIHERTDACGFVGVFSFAGMSGELAEANMRLFADKVMPRVRQLGHAPAFDEAIAAE